MLISIVLSQRDQLGASSLRTHLGTLSLPKNAFAPRRIIGFISLVRICRNTVCRVDAGLRVLSSRFRIQFDRSPVRRVRHHLGSIDSVVNGLRHGGLPVDIGSVGSGLFSITNVHIVYGCHSSICSISGCLSSRSSVRILHIGSCVGGPGRGKCHSLRMVCTIPIFLSSNTRCAPIRIRFHAVTVSC